MANWFFLVVAVVLFAATAGAWNHYQTLAWFLAAGAIACLAFAVFASHSRKAATLDVVVTFVVGLGFLA